MVPLGRKEQTVRDLVFPTVIDTFHTGWPELQSHEMPEQSPQREQVNTIVWAIRPTGLRRQLKHGSAAGTHGAAILNTASSSERAVEIAVRSDYRATYACSVGGV